MPRNLLDILFPRRCVGCGSGLWPFCERCVERMIALEPPWCERCGFPTVRRTPRCRRCPPDPLSLARSAFMHGGPVRAAVLRLKFGGDRTVVEALGSAMAAVAPTALAGVSRSGSVGVTWVPLSRLRRAERGFDQAELLARFVARSLDLPVEQLLERSLELAPQAQWRGRERRSAVRGAFACREGSRVPADTLLVDDVLTTGSTAAACAEALMAGGATRVTLLAAARSAGSPGGPPLYSERVPVRVCGCPGKSSPVVDASRGRSDPRKATFGR